MPFCGSAGQFVSVSVRLVSGNFSYCEKARDSGRGAGERNVFRDLGHKNGDAQQVKAILSLLNRLGSRVEVKIRIRRARPPSALSLHDDAAQTE